MRIGALHYDDVVSLRTFLALAYREFNTLAFNQSFEAAARDSAEVCEHVWAIFLLDEAEAFSFVEPFYCASNCRHISILSFQK